MVAAARLWAAAAAPICLLLSIGTNAKPGGSGPPDYHDFQFLTLEQKEVLNEFAKAPHDGGVVPPWAVEIPNLFNYTAAFEIYSPEATEGCKIKALVFGRQCGFCQEDCAMLTSQLAGRLVPKEHADVIFLTPELSTLSEGGVSRTARLAELPPRPAGKFYFVHKVSRGLADSPERTDCGRLWPSGVLRPPAALPGGAPLPAFCALLFRPDFIFADVDLGEHDVDDDGIGHRLLGFTLPTGGWTDRHRYAGDVMRRFAGGWPGESSGAREGRAVEEEKRRGGGRGAPPPLPPPGGQAALPRLLVWFRGKCHGSVRSKCKFNPERCTAVELANSERLGGKASRARFEMAMAFNHRTPAPVAAPLRGVGAAPNSSSTATGGGGGDGGGGSGRDVERLDDVRVEWVGDMKECPGVVPSAAGSGGGGSGGGANAVITDEFSAHAAGGEQAYFRAMEDAWFSFCPHGDQRWNIRFLELLGAGAVPVLVADGLENPFGKLVDWPQVV